MAFGSARSSLLAALLLATALRSCTALSPPDCERKDGERAACSYFMCGMGGTSIYVFFT